jgi:hypothetical protein
MERRSFDNGPGRAFVGLVFIVSLVLCGSRERVRAAGRDNPSTPDATVDRLIAPDGVVAMVPANLKVPESLKPILEDVLRRSPTFRRQLQQLRRAPRVRMAISYGDLSIWHVLRAESTMYRYEWGAMKVDTRLYTVRDIVDVIAHELEHVCEQIEGLDVKTLARQRHSGVYNTGGHYETQRAVLTGRQVAREALGVNTDQLAAHHTN